MQVTFSGLYFQPTGRNNQYPGHGLVERSGWPSQIANNLAPCIFLYTKIKKLTWNEDLKMINSLFWKNLKHYLLGGLISGPNHLKNEPSVRTTFSIRLYSSRTFITRVSLDFLRSIQVSRVRLFFSKQPKNWFLDDDSSFHGHITHQMSLKLTKTRLLSAIFWFSG